MPSVRSKDTPRVDFTDGVILASYCCIQEDNFDRKLGLLLRVEEHRTRHQNGMDKRITLMGLLSFLFAADDIYEPKPTSLSYLLESQTFVLE